MKNKSYYFLASPYNGSEEEKLRRHGLSKKIAATFLEHKISLFAPILYNQAIIDYFPEKELENRRSLLMPMNMDFLLSAKSMILLKLQNPVNSWGINQYLEACSKEKIKIYELDEQDLDSGLNSLIQELAQTLSTLY